MAHPVIPQVLAVAIPVADKLGLEIVNAVFQTNHSPPTLRIGVRNRYQDDTGLEDCEQMSFALGEVLDSCNLLADAYVLEVSSPGVSDWLSCDRDFTVFKGFNVVVQLKEAHKGKCEWLGKLVERTPETLLLNQKGRMITLPREAIASVKLTQTEED